jgi:hypothetical protein
MTTKQLIQAEIENLSDEGLDELYKVIKQFVQTSTHHQSGILSKLRQVEIEAPPDFAANLDLYLSGEKQIGD